MATTKAKKSVKKAARAKKPSRPAPRKKSVRRQASRRVVTSRAPKPIGAVTHFYNHLNVAIVRFKKPVGLGVRLHFKGATTDFVAPVRSMQFDHASIARAPKGKQVGIKVPRRVREGDQVYEAR